MVVEKIMPLVCVQCLRKLKTEETPNILNF